MAKGSGIESKGNKPTKIFPNDGPKVLCGAGGKKKAGVSTESMKTMGRNLARVANQGG